MKFASSNDPIVLLHELTFQSLFLVARAELSIWQIQLCKKKIDKKRKSKKKLEFFSIHKHCEGPLFSIPKNLISICFSVFFQNFG